MYEAQPPSPQEGPGSETQQRFLEIYNNYTQALQVAWAPEDVQQRGAYAHAQYMQVLQEVIPAHVQQLANEAYGAYMRVLQEALAPADMQRQAAEAFRVYVRALRETWTHVDADTLDANSLAVIAQTMLGIVWLASLAQPGTQDASGSETLPQVF